MMVRKYTRQLGLEGFTAHSLRRFVGTELAEKFGVRVAQKALGHASSRTTEEHYILDGEVPLGLTDKLF